MNRAQTTRFACGECNIIFDLCPVEWRELSDDYPPVEEAEPTCCPYCGSGDIKSQHDRPARPTGD